MDKFFAGNDKQYLVFFYQEPEVEANPNEGTCLQAFARLLSCSPRSLGESYRRGYSPYTTRPNAGSTKPAKPKVIIADPDKQSLRGVCLTFLRNSKKGTISAQNIANVGGGVHAAISPLRVVSIGGAFLHFRMQHGTVAASTEPIDR